VSDMFRILRLFLGCFLPQVKVDFSPEWAKPLMPGFVFC